MESQQSEFIAGKVNWKGQPAKKGKHGGLRASALVLALFAFENLATLALSVNLVTYFVGIMHFNLAESANHLTNYMAIGYILSVFMAFLADTCLGRFTTLLISTSFEFVGLGILALQAHSPKLKPRPCNLFDPTIPCKKVDGGNEALLFTALYLLAMGSGGIKATLPSHGADQFEEKDPKEAKQMSSFFNMLLLAVCIGGAGSLTFVVWIQDNKGWEWGFATSAFAVFAGILVLVAGLPLYRIHVIQETNPLIDIIQVYVAAVRNRSLQLPRDPKELYEISKEEAAAKEIELLPHRDVFRFLDKAAVQTTPPQKLVKPSPWRLCSVTQVENAKILMSMVPIFCCTFLMTLCLAQLQTFSIQQAITMDRKLTKSFSIPGASLAIIPVVFLLFLIPFYDRIVVPLARRFTGTHTGITHLQRVGVGLLLAATSMAVAGIVEVKRKSVAKTHNMLDAIPLLQPLPITVFWLSIQYFIFGIADLFTYVGLLEFFYSQAPKGLKSVSTCFLWSSMAVGYFMSTILVNVVNKATKKITRNGGWLVGNNLNRNHLNLFYFLLAVLCIVNFAVYLFVSRRYNYRPQVSPEVLDDEDAGDRMGVSEN